MKGKFQLENPEKMKATLTLTMTLEDWERLKGQLMTNWPGGHLYRLITDVLSQARKVYWPEEQP